MTAVVAAAPCRLFPAIFHEVSEYHLQF